MANEFKLSYTAEEINKKLGQIDNMAGGGSAIIDVTELPTEGASESSFYRLLTGTLVYNQYTQDTYVCYCVETLPESGEPATNLDQTQGNVYYNLSDGELYGYVDDMLSMGLGVPAGWYPANTLLGALGYSYSGTITDIEDDPEDDAFRLLLTYTYHIYKDGWMEIPFGYEQAPKFDIKWDGEFGDRFVLDMSLLGFPNTYFVKITDEVFTAEQLIGATHSQSSGYLGIVSEDVIDATTYPGAISVDNGVTIVHSADVLNSALGLPSGYITNGIYFVYIVDDLYTDRLVAPTRTVKIDNKFLPTMDVDIWGSLPKPTSADNGKILQVVNGEATWVGVNIAEEAIF